jgi:hypothetical protein
VAIYAELLSAADRVKAECAYHPCPPPKIGSLIKPKACTCYAKTPEFRAFMAWESPTGNHCGGRERCKPGCEVLDQR